MPLPAVAREPDLLGAGVLGDGLGALADGVLGQLAGKQQADGRLDLATRDRRAAVVVRQTRRLGGDALEDVVDERVHDRHGLAADARVGVDLLQHLVDVDGVAFPSPPLALLVSRADGLRLAGGLLRSLACWLRRHDRVDSCVLVWRRPQSYFYSSPLKGRGRACFQLNYLQVNSSHFKPPITFIIGLLQ